MKLGDLVSILSDGMCEWKPPSLHPSIEKYGIHKLLK